VFTFAKSGRVILNERVAFPQGGWPGQLGLEAEEAAGAAGSGPAGTGPPDATTAAPTTLDAGEWDGSGFVSTGLVEALTEPVFVSVTFTEPGTYKLACLIHPRMVGEVEVS
jgi:hypothetical protein